MVKNPFNIWLAPSESGWERMDVLSKMIQVCGLLDSQEEIRLAS